MPKYFEIWAALPADLTGNSAEKQVAIVVFHLFISRQLKPQPSQELQKPDSVNLT